jgi:hypothetical protein
MTASIGHRTALLIEGWNVGFNKVAFTNMLQHELGLSLSAAKNITDQILERRPVTIHVREADIKRITSLAQKIGAIVSSECPSTLTISERSCQ